MSHVWDCRLPPATQYAHAHALHHNPNKFSSLNLQLAQRQTAVVAAGQLASKMMDNHNHNHSHNHNGFWVDQFNTNVLNVIAINRLAYEHYKKAKTQLEIFNQVNQSMMGRKIGVTQGTRSSRRLNSNGTPTASSSAWTTSTSAPTTTIHNAAATAVAQRQRKSSTLGAGKKEPPPTPESSTADASNQFGVTFCPECKTKFNDTNVRPVQEGCGHVKCRSCLIRNEDGCKQCKWSGGTGSCSTSSACSSTLVVTRVADTNFISNSATAQRSSSNSNVHSISQSSSDGAIWASRGDKTNPRALKRKTLSTPVSQDTPRLSFASSLELTQSEYGSEPKRNRKRDQQLQYYATPIGATGSNVRKVELGNEIAPSPRNGITIHRVRQPATAGNFNQSNVSDNLPNSFGRNTNHVPIPNWAASIESLGDSNHVQIRNSSHISDDSDGSQLGTICPSQLQQLQLPGQSNGEHSGAGLICENSNSTTEDGGDNSQKSGSGEKKKKKRSPVFIHDHIKILSGDPQMYQCSICTKKFKTKAHIKYHEFCQNGEKPFRCEECGQGFIAKSHYEYHLRTHTGERPYVCPKCGKGFNQRGKVTRHMRSHTGEKPFHCETCGRGFANAQAMRSHYLIHTGERPFACEHCSKRFTGMTNLKKHIITHTGERPFMCVHCGKSFGLKWTLDLHMRTHSSERPFACDQCSRAFSNSKDLRRHLVIHSGERPFKCWLCGTAFRRKDNLDRHIKNTHNQPKEVAKQLANQAAAEYLAATKAANNAIASTSTSSTLPPIPEMTTTNNVIPSRKLAAINRLNKRMKKPKPPRALPPPQSPAVITPPRTPSTQSPQDSSDLYILPNNLPDAITPAPAADDQEEPQPVDQKPEIPEDTKEEPELFELQPPQQSSIDRESKNVSYLESNIDAVADRSENLGVNEAPTSSEDGSPEKSLIARLVDDVTGEIAETANGEDKNENRSSLEEPQRSDLPLEDLQDLKPRSGSSSPFSVLRQEESSQKREIPEFLNNIEEVEDGDILDIPPESLIGWNNRADHDNVKVEELSSEADGHHDSNEADNISDHNLESDDDDEDDMGKDWKAKRFKHQVDEDTAANMDVRVLRDLGNGPRPLVPTPPSSAAASVNPEEEVPHQESPQSDREDSNDRGELTENQTQRVEEESNKVEKVSENCQIYPSPEDNLTIADDDKKNKNHLDLNMLDVEPEEDVKSASTTIEINSTESIKQESSPLPEVVREKQEETFLQSTGENEAKEVSNGNGKLDELPVPSIHAETQVDSDEKQDFKSEELSDSLDTDDCEEDNKPVINTNESEGKANTDINQENVNENPVELTELETEKSISKPHESPELETDPQIEKPHQSTEVKTDPQIERPLQGTEEDTEKPNEMLHENDENTEMETNGHIDSQACSESRSEPPLEALDDSSPLIIDESYNDDDDDDQQDSDHEDSKQPLDNKMEDTSSDNNVEASELPQVPVLEDNPPLAHNSVKPDIAEPAQPEPEQIMEEVNLQNQASPEPAQDVYSTDEESGEEYIEDVDAEIDVGQNTSSQSTEFGYRRTLDELSTEPENSLDDGEQTSNLEHANQAIDRSAMEAVTANMGSELPQPTSNPAPAVEMGKISLSGLSTVKFENESYVKQETATEDTADATYCMNDSSFEGFDSELPVVAALVALSSSHATYPGCQQGQRQASPASAAVALAECQQCPNSSALVPALGAADQYPYKPWDNPEPIPFGYREVANYFPSPEKEFIPSPELLNDPFHDGVTLLCAYSRSIVDPNLPDRQNLQFCESLGYRNHTSGQHEYVYAYTNVNQEITTHPECTIQMHILTTRKVEAGQLVWDNEQPPLFSGTIAVNKYNAYKMQLPYYIRHYSNGIRIVTMLSQDPDHLAIIRSLHEFKYMLMNDYRCSKNTIEYIHVSPDPAHEHREIMALEPPSSHNQEQDPETYPYRAITNGESNLYEPNPRVEHASASTVNTLTTVNSYSYPMELELKQREGPSTSKSHNPYADNTNQFNSHRPEDLVTKDANVVNLAKAIATVGEMDRSARAREVERQRYAYASSCWTTNGVSSPINTSSQYSYQPLSNSTTAKPQSHQSRHHSAHYSLHSEQPPEKMRRYN